MDDATPVDLGVQLDAIYRAEAGRVLAALIRLLGSFDVAEDAMHDAFRAAAERWSKEGIPRNPRAWLVSTARFKAIDSIRRQARLDEAEERVAENLHGSGGYAPEGDDEVPDDRLRLIFTCCHPALPPESRTALTLRELCGLTT
ncbi:MAG TPA: sigma factor, partial [Acidobacteriota bacterium]|nr:sigma factor [Acidobacteriota bacterium]